MSHRTVAANFILLTLPGGGYEKFVNEGWHKKWLPTWLQKAGYNTYFTGKLMNGHSITNYKKGLNELSLTGHDFMIQPGTYQYLNTTMQHNEEKPKTYPGVYATDLLTNRSLAWIDHAHDSKKPFFLAINPVNPHGNYQWGKGGTPPIPAERYKGLFDGVQVPRTANFNPDRPSGASWLLGLEKHNDTNHLDNWYSVRLEALQAVDDMVNRTIARLDKLNLLDNTYIIYTSDNGYHIGQHRLNPGKRCAYEEDINVPLIIRGPGIPKDKTADFVTSHTDIVPSIVKWANAKHGIDFDGAAIPTTTSESIRTKYEHASIEHWGGTEHENVPQKRTINTYKALRLIGNGYNLFYSVWCDGSHEIYDMMVSTTRLAICRRAAKNRLRMTICKCTTCTGQVKQS